MKKLFGTLVCVAGLTMMGSCDGSTKKAAGIMGGANDSTATEETAQISDGDTVVSIYKVWINEDSTHIFDLRDDTHYVEAMRYDEDYCKESPDYKPGVYYINTEAGGFQIGHNFDDEPDTIGSIDYLLEQGPYAGTYATRFSFYNLTPKTATFLFEGEYEWTYTVLDKPVELQPDPHPYVYEE